MEDYLKRNCPGCGSSKILESGTTRTSTKAEDLRFNDLFSSWNEGLFKEKVIFTYRRCADCGLLYCPVFFTPGQLQKLYSSMPANMSDVPPSILEKTQFGYLKTIAKRTSLIGSYLEIGPDTGLLAAQISRAGKFGTYWFFEPNVNVHEELRRTVTGDAECHISNEMFSLETVPDDSVDLAVMVHVLDHLLDPAEMLSQLCRKLKKGAVLAIVVHDESSMMAKILGNRWLPFCLYHPEVYNPTSIRHLLGKSGFGNIQVSKTTNVFPVNYLLRHVLWTIGLRNRYLSTFLSKLPLGDIPLKLGNIMVLASPKKS